MHAHSEVVMLMSTRIWAYVALVLLSVVVRVAWIVHARPFEEPQGAEMELAARSLAQHGYIGHIFEPQSLNGTRSAHVAPLYPMMVGSMFRLFGWNTFPGRAAQEALAIIGTVLGFALLPTAAGRLRLPQAVELVTSSAAHGTVRQLFLVGSPRR